MSNEHQPDLFLSGQQLSQLKKDLPLSDRKAHVCGSTFDKDVWLEMARDDLHQPVTNERPWWRGLVCDAGLGKTTNMEWLQAHLAKHSQRQVPLLLQLHRSRDRELLEEELTYPSQQALLKKCLTEDVFRANHRSAPIALADLLRRQAAGHLTLLIDGLDHVSGQSVIQTNLAKMLASAQWRHCPAWIAGRPTAFDTCWESLFAHPEWQFLRVHELAKPEIRFYLSHNAGGDLYHLFPAETRRLLAIPRFLQLICGILRTALAGLESASARKEAVARLDLRTPAAVYHKAFFTLGTEDKPNSQGLLAQGLRDEAEGIGLDEGERPAWNNWKKRVERTGALVGALAFQLLDTKSKQQPQPNFGGVRLDPFQDRVAKRMQAADQGTVADFSNDFGKLRHMNIHLLDFLLFRESDDERLAFHDRTTQSFFAAYWACRHAASDELQATRQWVVDALFEKNLDFREFWQFAAEMPDKALPRTEEEEVDEGRWLTLFRPLYDGSVRDEKGRPIRSTEYIYRSWERMAQSETGQRIIAEKYRAQSIPQEMLKGFIPLVRNVLPQDNGTFNIGEEDRDNPVTLTHYCLHQYCVTNREYELFDPRHQECRWWKGEQHRAVEELKDRSADDACPVVMVSWYDAICYARWLGRFVDAASRHYEIALPTEAQWEYACRAGRRTRFTFDEAHQGKSCTPAYCNFDGNHPDKGEKKGECRWRTVPVDGNIPPAWGPLQITEVKGRNRWGLYQMHGNVWEWCADGGDAAVSFPHLRGGSWSMDAELLPVRAP